MRCSTAFFSAHSFISFSGVWKVLYTSCTTLTSSSTLGVERLDTWHARELKKARSRRLQSGELGGCAMMRMRGPVSYSIPACCIVSTMPLPTCGVALSICTVMTRAHGMAARSAGMTLLSIMSSKYSASTFTSFSYTSPFLWYLLVRLAVYGAEHRHIPIFPLNPRAMFGTPIAHKNITLGTCILECIGVRPTPAFSVSGSTLRLRLREKVLNHFSSMSTCASRGSHSSFVCWCAHTLRASMLASVKKGHVYFGTERQWSRMVAHRTVSGDTTIWCFSFSSAASSMNVLSPLQS
mmetsp:Transcript_4867/g.12351  ORF Transcript_4867/g.12351 Transcript_4867/m.12351 type:complete len:294 (-) Transcript_4867:666-1547(-)